MLLLGIDVGTTGAKAAVFDQDGEMKGYGFQGYGMISERKEYAEQDAEQIFICVKQVVKQAVLQAGSGIAALSLSVQGDAIIPVDKQGNALCNAHLGMDYRGKSELEKIEGAYSDQELFQKTGMRIHPLNAFVKMLWIKQHAPKLYDSTYKFTTYSDYILKKLGSEKFVIDHTMASRTMCADIETFEWKGEILDALEFDAVKLSEPVRPGTVVGTLIPQLADELGISQGCLIVAGGHDQTCAALGAGIVEENMALDSHGTAEVLSMAFQNKKTDEAMFEGYYPCYAHVVAGMYFTFALNHTGGIVFQWFAEQFCGQDAAEGKNVYESLIEHMGQEPSPVTLIPQLNGSGTPTCDLGAKGSVFGLTLATTRYDVAQAVLEALCFEMRNNMDALRKAGVENDCVRCVGGGARSPKILQMKADIFGIPVQTLKIREAACLGAAILAGYGAGVYADLKEAAAKVVKTDRTYRPDAKRKQAYDLKYGQYRHFEEISRAAYVGD